MDYKSDHSKLAQQAGLRYVSDSMPGYYREKKGKGFCYKDANGNTIKDEELIERFKKLVIPPAWQKVWISPFENSHLQVTGLDAKGRKQYRYHPLWSKVRNETKFHKLPEFAAVLPKLREKAARDMARPQLDKKKVLGVIVKLMEKSHIRIGNKEYENENGSYGITTLKDDHVDIKGEKLSFDFKGKSGVMHSISLKDRKLANAVRKCRDIPGQELFQFYDSNGQRRCIDSGDVNEYIKAITGSEFTAKDFRTWAGTLHAFNILRTMEPALTFNKIKTQIVDVIKITSGHLGNTVSVCRKYYIHPLLFEAFSDGRLHRYFKDNTIIHKEEELLLGFLKAKH